MIVGISGYARSGKDTVANHLVAEYGFTRIGFADALRDALFTLDPIVGRKGISVRYSEAVNNLGYELAKDQYPEIRRLLQRMGTEVGRRQWGEDFWVNLVEKKIVHSNETKYVTADCRFPSEAQLVHRLNGCLFRVHRPGYGPVNDHPSETALDDWIFDRHIHNDGDLDFLRLQVDLLVQDVGLDG